MSRRKRGVNAVDEAHARRLCLQGRGPVYLDGVEYEFRLVPEDLPDDLSAISRAMQDLREAQSSTPVEDQVERVCENYPAIKLSNRDRDVFVEALENPPQPNAALRAAKGRHESDVVKDHAFEDET